MAYHDAGALFGRKCVVRVDAVLVFGEERGVVHLADVVVQGACAHKLLVGPHGAGGV